MIRKIKCNDHAILGNLELDFTKPDGSVYNTIVLAGENGTGKTTILEELLSLFRQYAQQNYGVEPDDYEDIDYDDITYDEFVSFIRECLATGKEIPDVVD